MANRKRKRLKSDPADDGYRELAEFAAQIDASANKCKTCAQSEAIRDKIAKLVEWHKAGKVLRNWSSICDFLRKTYGYEGTPQSLRRHIRRCLGYDG